MTERQEAVTDVVAEMREALVQCELFLGHVSRHGHPTLNPGDKCTACDGVDELRGMVVRALAAPPRVCDVNTLESLSDFVEKTMLTSDLLKDTHEIVKRIMVVSVRTALTIAYEPVKRK